MKNINNFLLILVSIISISCSPILTPAIHYENYNYSRITNIKGSINGLNFKGLTRLESGGSASEAFYIKNKNDIFGPIHIEWQNQAGKDFFKDFILNKSQITYDRKNHYIGKSIMFFFYDNDVEMYISQGWPDKYVIQKREKRKAEVNLRK